MTDKIYRNREMFIFCKEHGLRKVIGDVSIIFGIIPDRKIMNDVKIDCFIFLAETLSFTETASILYLSQQAVSKNISQLEEELGFPLLNRNNHMVSLTEAGEKCYKIFKDFRTNMNSFKAHELNEGLEENVPVIKVGCQNWIDYGSHRSKIINSIKDKIPSIKIIFEVHSPSVLVSLLESKKLDIIIIQERFLVTPIRIMKSELTRSNLAVIYSLSLIDTGKDILSLPVLIDSCAFGNERGNLLHTNDEAAQCNFEPNSIVVLPNRDTVYSSVELGFGITIGSTISEAARNPKLHLSAVEAKDSLLCVWREGDLSLTTQTFVHCAEEEYCCSYF